MRHALFVLALLLLMPGCATGPVRHVYLTWQGDTGTTMTVNFHTMAPAQTEVYWDTEPRDGVFDAYRHRATGASRQIPGLRDGRWIHTVELTGLAPGETYYFAVPGAAPAERKFRTLPGDSSPIRFVEGGDVGYLPAVLRLFRRAAEREPHFVAIGGDIAYENGNVDNAGRYDLWLHYWEEAMVTPSGYTVPLIAAIGNHESNGDFDDPDLAAPFYFGYFPQGGSSSFTRALGPHAVLIALDSGHIQDWETQVSWLREVLTDNIDTPFRFATYHVPLYPSHRDFNDGRSVAGRTHWLPLFDEFGLDIAFEHHDHTYKRTKRLRGGAEDPGGTLYLGDGCMGMPARTVNNLGAPYLERAAPKRHFWLIEVTPTQATCEAIDPNGQVFDRVVLPAR